MRLFNPSFGHPIGDPAQKTSSTPAPVHMTKFDWARDPAVLFSNSKPGARQLLEGIAATLVERFGRPKLDFRFKGNAGIPAEPSQIEEMGRQYRGAIVALGD